MSGAANAETYQFSTFLEPNHIITRFQNTEWADAVRAASNGEIDFEVFTGGALLPPLGTLQGIADGVAQAGVVAAAYSPSQLPVSNAIGDMGFLNPDSMVLAFAYGDFMMNEKVGYDNWRNNGVIFGASHATPVYNFLCTDEVFTLADLQGKRVRMPGGGVARFGAAIGLIPVNVPASEIYTALERGAVDCVCSDPTHLTSGSTILDLVDSVVRLPMSPVYTTGAIVYNPDFWSGLTNEQRRLLFDETARATVRLQLAFDRETEEALAEAEEKGVVLVEPDASLQQAYDDWVANGVGGMAQIASDQYGITDPAALFALFETYIDRWEQLLEGVDRTDEDALTTVLKTNLFDKIDVATYGKE